MPLQCTSLAFFTPLPLPIKGHTAESSGGEEAAVPEEREPEDPSRNLPDKPEAATLYGIKAMKPKKREFLKKRKQKKQGQGGGGEGGEGSLEASIMEDRHKPAFGEQAMQPLKVGIRSPCTRLRFRVAF